MKKIIMFALLSFIFYGHTKAGGIPVVYCPDCEYIIIVADLPDSAEFYSEEYKGYMDISYKYNQFWVVWLPFWNTKGQYCLSIKGQDEVYFEVTPQELDEYAKKYNLTLPANPIPIWDKVGGKVVLGLIAAFALWYYVIRRKKGSKVEDKQ
jgi:hypothetical protein